MGGTMLLLIPAPSAGAFADTWRTASGKPMAFSLIPWPLASHAWTCVISGLTLLYIAFESSPSFSGQSKNCKKFGVSFVLFLRHGILSVQESPCARTRYFIVSINQINLCEGSKEYCAFAMPFTNRQYTPAQAAYQSSKCRLIGIPAGTTKLINHL